MADEENEEPAPPEEEAPPADQETVASKSGQSVPVSASNVTGSIKPVERQKLFFLELIVDDISLDFCNAKQLICFGAGKTVIEFTFLDIGPLRIIEDDFMPVKKHYLEGCSGTGSIKNGKSILFGLTQSQAEEVAKAAIIYCTIIKKTEDKEIGLGSCIIRIINMFKDLLTMVEEGVKPLYQKNIKDCYKIKDITTGDLVGHVYAYVRLSCLNELIINKVKKDPNEEIDYKPEPGVYKYKYNKQVGPETPIEPPPCLCIGNLTTDKACCCPESSPADNCPQICVGTDCLDICPKVYTPCEWCPKTCKKSLKRPEPIPEKVSKHKNGDKGKDKGGKKNSKKKKGK